MVFMCLITNHNASSLNMQKKEFRFPLEFGSLDIASDLTDRLVDFYALP